MIYQIFDSITGKHIEERNYFDRTPTGQFWTEGKLVKELDKIYVLTDIKKKKIVAMTTKEFAEYKVLKKILILKETEKIGDDGSVIPKTRSDLIADKLISLEDLRSEKIQQINAQASEQIIGGFESSALGSPHIYDSELEDQFNIKSIADLEIDSPIRCKNKATNLKTFLPHKEDQIKNLVNEFHIFKMNILKNADQLKIDLSKLTDSESVQNFKTN